MKIDAEKQAGAFKGDVLVAGLGKEHPGHTRGVGVYAPWKTGCDWTLEDKRESKKAKKTLEMAELRASLKAEIIAEIMAKLRRGELPPLGPSPDPHQSPCASRDVTPDTDMSYPCDHIEVIKPIDHTKYIYIHQINYEFSYGILAS